jgi:hypothetical protein
MSATVYRLGEDQRTSQERESDARRRITRARGAVIDGIRRGDDLKVIEADLNFYERVSLQGWQVFERRARKAEKALRAVLGAELTDEQAATALSAIYGCGGERRRNPGGLSDNEQAVVDWYRRMDGDGRVMLRELARRLSEAAR